MPWLLVMFTIASLSQVILAALDRLSKNRVPPSVQSFVRDSTEGYGKAKLVLRGGRFFIESRETSVLKQLLKDKVIAAAAEGAVEANKDKDEAQARVQAQAQAQSTPIELASQPAPMPALPKEASVGLVTDREYDQAVAMDTLTGKGEAFAPAEVVTVNTESDSGGGSVALTQNVADENDDDDSRMYSFEIKASAGEVRGEGKCCVRESYPYRVAGDIHVTFAFRALALIELGMCLRILLLTTLFNKSKSKRTK